MTNDTFTTNPQNVSTLNEEERERLVKREVLCNASCLVQDLMGQEKYWEDLAELFGQEDEDGNVPEVFEYWIITPWLGEKLKAHGELVTKFLDLTIWGRQTTGQRIYIDGVIGDITKKILTQ
jgi:hypothetical protein